jgi:HEPN domain-containing protein/predicted nucleotidyltransferase
MVPGQETMKTEIITTIKTTLESNRFPFTVSGAVLFGSLAKGSHDRDSDIDLLVVAENINPRLHRRKKEILALKHSLPGKALDILLLSPKEVISNFTNHNPLFLDIAQDGIIIKDERNFLRDLINKTRKYIEAKSIKRLEYGWQFPVAYRTATLLSNVSNKDFAEAMLKDGERDFLIGKNLLRDEFFDKSVYHFQQSAEKCIKSVLAVFGTFQKTHFIGKILIETIPNQSLPDQWKQKLTKIAGLSEELEPDVSLSRYPGIINNMLWMQCDEYEREDAEESLKKAETVLNAARDFCQYWFSQEEDQEKEEIDETEGTELNE